MFNELRTVEAEPVKIAVVKNLLRFEMKQVRSSNSMNHVS